MRARVCVTRALLEFINMNSRVRRAKSEIHYYDNNLSKVRSVTTGSYTDIYTLSVGGWYMVQAHSTSCYN